MARIEELKALCNKYPIAIPVREAAQFLGISPECLRASCMQGRCPFGFAWASVGSERTGYKIPTLTFFCWITKGAVAMD